MNKITIDVPEGIRYISDWKEFNLPENPCIINKQITGCGFTEWCIRNNQNIILCSPRKILLENKEEQHPGEVFYLRNDSDKVIDVDKDLNKDDIKAGLEEGSKVGYVDVANYNSPAQVVITGAEDAVKATSDYLLANGVRRVVPLAVSGAFHSKFMEKAGTSFAEFIADVELNNASIPVITNVDAEATNSKEDFRAKMPKQIYSSVYWTQTIEKMVAEGVDTFIEIGPGKVLAGLNKKIAPEANVYNVFDLASLDATVEALKEQFIGV